LEPDPDNTGEGNAYGVSRTKLFPAKGKRMTTEGKDKAREERVENTPAGKARHHRWLPLWVVLVVAVLVAAGAYGAYEYLTQGGGCQRSNTVVIDVYDSFMGSGASPNASRSAVFHGFEQATGSCVQVNYVTTDVANLITSEPSSQLPDIAIGLNEVTAEALGLEGLLVPYAPPGLTYVSPSLVNGISPENYATPFEWQYLGVDYVTGLDNATGHALMDGDIFQTVAGNATLAHQFLYENPTTDPVGKEFLLWEYQFYTSVLHQNWETFWEGANSNMPPATPSWSTGISEFGPSPSYQMFVSFGTDPAYFATFPAGFSMNTTFSNYNGTSYAWKTIYGAGIVKAGAHNLGLDKEFINWLLSPTVQDLVPLNEWMYPANNTVTLPSVYSANPSVGNVVALNGYTSPRAIAGNLTGLLLQWQGLS
jgi:thiamine transport system substrate-binding protein